MFNQEAGALNICIDIGNTNSKIGIFESDLLTDEKSGLLDRGVVKMIAEMQPDAVIIGSVRRGINKVIEKSRKIAKTLVLDHNLALPIQSKYKSPETLGVDRIAAAVGAVSMFGGANTLVIDIGTCITYDFVDEHGMYHGGGISPGVEMRLKAMHKFTSRLPVVAPKGMPDLIGQTTKDCMLSGAICGAEAELEGIIGRYRQFFGELNIIFCGGGANFFESKIKDHIFAVPNLVLVGLNHILRYNLNA